LLPQHSEPLLRKITDDDEPTALPQAPAVLPVPVASFREVDALSSRLVESRPAEGGHRALLTGEASGIDPTQEAIDIAKALTQIGAQVILIDWSLDGRGFARSIGLDPTVGLNDLLRGEANFGDIIQRVPGSAVHAIASGKPFDDMDDAVDSDQLNLVLDALDEAYDHIIVVGGHDEARKLFELIEGRFDAGIAVAEPRKLVAAPEDPAGTFLGFEVADIDIVRFERQAAEPAPVHQRIARVSQRPSMQLARQA